MDFDKYFDNLNDQDEISLRDEKTTCCSDMNNFIIHNGITTCKECNSIVSNISDGAEWRYYGTSDSKSSE